MKAFAPFLAAFFLVAFTMSIPQRNTTSLTKMSEAQKPVQLIDFEKQVLPIMISNCSPCHFTGGKMYRLLPFDKDTTILHHGEKILPRLSKKDEQGMLNEFLQQQKKVYNEKSRG